MNYTDPFVLREDVLLIPCADLSDDLRERITFDEGDVTLSRRHGRALAQVIDRDTAALLELFRRPRTIVDAIVENSSALSKDPEVLFEQMLPHLGTFIENRVLVPAGSEEEKEIRPRFNGGTTIAGYRIVRCASLIEDSEIYQVRGDSGVAALKIARQGTPQLRQVFENEATMLRHLEGSDLAPRLLCTGTVEDRPYLIIEWIAGIDAATAAAQQRHDRTSLIELCANIAAAYAALHERGVLHADVHARNILVGAGGVKIVDFGYACFIDQPAHLGRAGVAQFLEPEYLAAEREGRSIPASEAGEQYALAALLYLLIAGRPYVDFRYERDEMTRQAETERPLPFAQHGLPPWPDVESILFRALEKNPARRHPSMRRMSALLEDLRDRTRSESLAMPLSVDARALLESTLRTLAPGGEWYAARYPVPPRSSIHHGCAGAAVGLLRIAEVRGDPALLALAAVWQARAKALIGSAGAFYNADDELTPELVGRVTPYHTESGVHAAEAMIAAARGDTYSQQSAVAAFLQSSSRECPEVDITLGRLGSVLAAALLLGISDETPEAAAALRAFGSETLDAVWRELDARPPIEESPDAYLGMAHGWAGYLYATMRWCAASGHPLPPRLVDRLHQLAALKTLDGRGAFWVPRVGFDPSSNFPGWCNGSAGQLFTFVLAHELLGGDEWLRLAELAAWDNWDEPRAGATLCCGTAGRAYALLNFYKHTGSRVWLGRARALANHAASEARASSQRPNALWKGELGVAVLIADMESPENARMPFFE